MDNIISTIVGDLYKVASNRLPSIGYQKKNTSSISKRVRETGVLQFPMLVVDSLSLEENSMIAKAVERQNASWIAIITSMNSISSASNPKDYIKNIHTNLQPYVNSSNTLKESVEFKKMPLGHSKINELVLKEDFVNSIVDNGAIPYCEKKYNEFGNMERVSYKQLDDSETKELSNILSTNYPNNVIYKHNKLNSLYVDKSDNLDMSDLCQIVVLNDNDGKLVIKEAHVVTPENIDEYKNVFSKFSDSEIRGINIDSNKKLEPYKTDLNMNILNNKVPNNSGRTIFNLNNKSNYLNEAMSVSKINTLRSGAKSNDKVFLDSDAKKANELAPTLLQIQTYFRTFNGDLQPVNYIIGIKSVVHPISRDEVINFLLKSNNENNSKLLRFIKLTTGEISFMKDFLLTMDILKKDFKEKVNGHPWLSKLSKSRTGSKNKIPNASLVITMEEVSILKSEYGFDLTVIKNVQKLMNNYLFLSFIIADSGTETVYIFNEGDTTFSKFSYNALERENTNSAKDIKNIMNVLSRM